jgi:murein DD-endopeptidase MepM/ murein hydrolase activator NlpD
MMGGMLASSSVGGNPKLSFWNCVISLQRFVALGCALAGLTLGVFSLYAQASLSPSAHVTKTKTVTVAGKAKLPVGVTPVWLPTQQAEDPDVDLADTLPEERLIVPPEGQSPVSPQAPIGNLVANVGFAPSVGTAHRQQVLSQLSKKVPEALAKQPINTTEDDEERLIWQQVLSPHQPATVAHPTLPAHMAWPSWNKGKSLHEHDKFCRLHCFLTPVRHIFISSPFGPRHGRLHAGIDFAAPIGDTIHASAAGRILFANWGGGYGKMIIIDHGHGVMTRYAHCSRLTVSLGQWVNAGQVIALVGGTGHSTGPHLHYEVLVNGVAHNPSAYLMR